MSSIEKQLLQTAIKKYKTYVGNIEWHLKVNKPTGETKKECEIKIACYKEILKDLEYLSPTNTSTK